MLLAYEVRVLVSWLYALWLNAREARARAEAEAAADACTLAVRRASSASGQVHTDLIAASAAMKAVDRQQQTEERWQRLLRKADASWTRYERLNGRGGRTVPGLIATAQAWACAAVLTWRCPTWAADLVALLW